MRDPRLLFSLLAITLVTACGDSPKQELDAGMDAAEQDSAVTLAPPSISSFTADAMFITSGATTHLVAAFTGTSASISPGIGAVTSGMQVTVNPTVDTTYTLTVTGEDGTTRERSVDIRVFDNVYVVSTTAGSGEGSLLDAVTLASQAANESVILFSLPAPSTIELDTASLVTTAGSLLVVGPGAEALTISGGDARRVWFIGGGEVRVRGVTFAHGLGKGGNGGSAPGGGAGGGGAGMGGAVFVNAGDVSFIDVVFDANVAQGGTGGSSSGGGLANGGGGGGFGGDGVNGSTSMAGAGGAGGASGLLGGAAGTASAPGGDGAGGKGAGAGQQEAGGAAGFGGGGGGSGGFPGAGAGGFGAAAGAGVNPVSGAFGGTSRANGAGGGAGLGGAIFVRAGTLVLARCSFTDNAALGGAPGTSLDAMPATRGQAKGGAVFSRVPTITLTDVTYSGSIAADATGTDVDSVDVYLTP